jgi:YggT family protein
MFFFPLSIFGLIALLLKVAEILIVVRCILSFVPSWRRHPAGIIVVALTEPLLLPFRGLTRAQGGGIGIDFSPMVVLLIIHVIRLVIFRG